MVWYFLGRSLLRFYQQGVYTGKIRTRIWAADTCGLKMAALTAEVHLGRTLLTVYRRVTFRMLQRVQIVITMVHATLMVIACVRKIEIQ